MKHSKKNEDKFDTILFGVLIGAAIIVIAMCIMITAIPRQRTTKAVKYDLECVAGRSRNPLQECKE